ncbi:hypothetical protein [Kluyvera ascorbata]|uniref:hypothetical protein n=1 Tax=Kluyvera ascorbata TaxID=51288 RepID=UPI0039F682AF
MNDISALSLIAKIKKQTESYDTVVLREDEAKALVEALEVISKSEWNLAGELTVAQKKIVGLKEQLESRTVTVKLPELPVLGSNAEWYQGYAAGTSSMRKDCATALRAAGIQVIEGDT